MRILILLSATTLALATAVPATAHDHHDRDRHDARADDIGHGFHRYYGSEYGTGDERVRDGRLDRRDEPRQHRRGERERIPPPSI